MPPAAQCTPGDFPYSVSPDYFSTEQDEAQRDELDITEELDLSEAAENLDDFQVCGGATLEGGG